MPTHLHCVHHYPQLDISLTTLFDQYVARTNTFLVNISYTAAQLICLHNSGQISVRARLTKQGRNGISL